MSGLSIRVCAVLRALNYVKVAPYLTARSCMRPQLWVLFRDVSSSILFFPPLVPGASSSSLSLFSPSETLGLRERGSATLETVRRR